MKLSRKTSCKISFLLFVLTGVLFCGQAFAQVQAGIGVDDSATSAEKATGNTQSSAIADTTKASLRVVEGVVVSDAGDPLPNSAVEVKKGITVVDTFSVDGEGNFSYRFPEDGLFTLAFKARNLPAKILLFNIGSVAPEKQRVVISKLTRLETVVVGARRNTRRAEKQALGVTIIDQETIENSAISESADLSGAAGNLHALDTGSSISMYFALRGITSVNTVDPLIVFYIDDVAQFQTFNAPLQLVNLQSLQIYKGSQSTTYGRNAFAGVIDIKTKPQPNRLSGNASIDFDSTLSHSYMFNLAYPLMLNRIYGKLGGFFSMADGLVWNDTLGKRSDGFMNYNGYAAFDFYLDDAWQLNLSGKYDSSNEEPFPYVGGGLTFENNREIAFRHPYNINHNVDNSNEKNVGEAVVKLRFQGDYFRFFSVITYQNYLNKLELDTDFSAEDVSKVNLQADGTLITQEMKFSSTEETEKYFSWSAGSYAYFQLMDTQTDVNINLDLAPTLPFSLNKLKTMQQNFGIALFFNLVVPVGERLTFIAGGRVDVDYKQSDIEKNSFRNGVPVDETSFDQSRLDYFLTPKLGINFAFDEYISVYTSVTRGYRNGGLNSFVSSIDNLFFQPENSWQTEWGAKVRRDDLRFDFSFFYTFWEKQQVNVFFEGDFFQFGLVNAQESQSYGAEWEAKIPLVYGFSLGSVIGFSQSSFRKFTSQTGQNLEKKKQPFVPTTTFTGSVQHTYELLLGKAKVPFKHTNRLEHKYTSAIFYNPENTIKADDYHLLNFTSTMRIYNVTVSLWVKNILNSKFVGFTLPFGGITPVRLADPLRFGAKIGVYF